MTGQTKEENIMVSNDNSVTLTTHRVIQKTNEMNKEILLKDLSSYEIIKRKSNYYKVLSIVFAILTGLLLFLALSGTSRYMHEVLRDNELIFLILVLPAIITLIFVLLYNTSFEKFFKIEGHHNSIEFSIKGLNNSSLDKFMTRLKTESEIRKQEK
jgi:membrane-associated HD superfamily phosphohydrolase